MKGVYAILSKGIHELEEEECRRYFPILKLAIELILDQKIEEDMQKARDAEVTRQLSEIASKLKRGQTDVPSSK